ncbi:hypothetical protein F4778DRAFT_595872 [Xylariomycetidae sp. FL2044]|nr:hypothetical protein F4778DRAFT_595872 [Xylariomycetidae sp. FL2044]
MALKLLLHQLLIWTWISITLASNIVLGGDISALVPACATDCLQVFIENNYASTSCIDDASLDCLCTTENPSGFTIGEGAVQCIALSERNGSCNSNDVGSDATSKALDMCSSVPGALPNPHDGHLTITFVSPTSGIPSIIVSTPTTVVVTTTVVPTTLSTITSRTTPSLLPTSSSSRSTSSAATSSSTPTAVPAATPEPASTTTLTTPQIAGIAVGVFGAIALALGAIFMARRIRRRNFPDEDEKFYQTDEDRSALGAPAPREPGIFHISPPVFRTSKYRPPLQSSSPYPEPPSNINRSTIGIAISRPRSLVPARAPTISLVRSPPRTPETPVEKRHSRLLPAKPALTLQIPPQPTATRNVSSHPTATDRASTMTNMTAFADLDTEAAEGGQIWRPPPTDPLSATTLYVADKWGNWVLSNNNRQSQLERVAEPAELDTYTPLTKSPIERQEEAAKMAAAISASSPIRKPPPAFLSVDPADPSDRMMSRASSLYSQASAVRPNSRSNPPARSNTGSSSKSKKNSTVQIGRSDSKASVTTIATSSSAPFDDDDDPDDWDVTRLSHLSPVVESPSPISGRSPVTYPRIPGRLDGATLRYVPPPRRPDFTVSSPPGQLSPTLGSALPAVDSPSAYPAPLNPRRSQMAQQFQTTGSGFSPEERNIEIFPPRNPRRLSRIQAAPESTRASPAPAPASANNADPRPIFRFQTPPMQTGQSNLPFTPSPPTIESSSPAPRTPPVPPPRLDTTAAAAQPRKPGRPHIASLHTASPVSAATASSGTSSLLAKRLGNDRAAALALDASGRRRSRPGPGLRKDGGLLLSPELLFGTPKTGTLPQTPIWQPKLTPTRRGDDLFLNVQ